MATSHTAAGKPPVGQVRPPRHRTGPAASGRATPAATGGLGGLLRIQALAGNQAVARMLQVQRCGAVPPEECGCHGGGAEGQTGMPAVQRSAAGLGAPVVQRHPGFRVKPALQTEVLATPELQTAASSAALALEAGRSRGGAVERLQEALNSAGFDTPITSVFNAATRRAVAAFQAQHGIPFPTGRQAGPKTLSTLDDHLSGPTPPEPPAGCATYLPGEREASLSTPGATERQGGLGQDLRLINFAAGRGRMKPEHEAAVAKLIKDFDLFEPDTAFAVDFVRGFTDAVDSEDSNAILREERAIDVEFFLKSNGVPGTPTAQAATGGSYDAGCDPAGRSAARAVLIRLKRKPVEPPKPKPQPKSFAGCGAPLSARLDAAIPAAAADLNTVIGQLSARPLAPATRDALFVYFRREDEATAARAAGELGKTARGLANNPPVDCLALLGCGSDTHAVTNLLTGTIHICNGGALDPDQPNLERTLMHEGMHLFAGFGALGELSHGDAPECDEVDLAGQTAAVRLANADSYAALAIRMARAPSGIHGRAEHFHGNDAFLAAVPKNATRVRLADGPASAKVELRGIEGLMPTMQWRLTDDAGRHYLLLNLQGEIVAPDQATDATAILLGRRTRDLLAARNIGAAVLSTHLVNQAGVDRVVTLGLTFVP